MKTIFAVLRAASSVLKHTGGDDSTAVVLTRIVFNLILTLVGASCSLLSFALPVLPFFHVIEWKWVIPAYFAIWSAYGVLNFVMGCAFLLVYGGIGFVTGIFRAAADEIQRHRMPALSPVCGERFRS